MLKGYIDRNTCGGDSLSCTCRGSPLSKSVSRSWVNVLGHDLR